jgi:gliding motility-associated lipoprotein GldH
MLTFAIHFYKDMVKKIFHLLTPLAICFFLLSCGKEKVLFEKEYDLKNAQWIYSDTLNFAFNITDTMAIYDIVLAVKHTPQYAFQNMYTNIYTQFPKGERLKQLLNIDLANNAGKWEGKCSNSECAFEIPIQPGAFFNQTGQHTITLEQYMRADALAGINSISLKLIDKGMKRDLEAEKASKTKKKNHK